MRALADESGELVLELHRVLSDIDPARWHAGAADAARARLVTLAGRVAKLSAARWPDRETRLPATLMELRHKLAEMPDAEATMASAQARWMAFKASIVPAYEALEAALRAYEIHVPSLRPTNYSRNLTHVASAVGALLILWAVPTPAWAIAIAVPACLTTWALEYWRRRDPEVNAALMRRLSPIAHPHEHRRVNSATWYATSVAVLALFQAPLPGAIALAVLGLGDPCAALVGRRFGRITLRHGRTLEGSLTFFVVGWIAAIGIALIFAPAGLPFTAIVVASGVGAFVGALAELTSLRVDDNLSVPLASAAAAAIALAFV